uniref:Uncharacterized protein n=1 Tax=Physcomitrium patens TaxID=3218 RepID=A0A2K1L0U9_PHYPA|nr:hypothetical protein PHYPA_002450 [Physcomitrium patens]
MSVKGEASGWMHKESTAPESHAELTECTWASTQTYSGLPPKFTDGVNSPDALGIHRKLDIHRATRRKIGSWRYRRI